MNKNGQSCGRRWMNNERLAVAVAVSKFERRRREFFSIEESKPTTNIKFK